MIVAVDTDKNILCYDSYFRNPITVLDINNKNSGSIDIQFSDMPIALGSRIIEFGIKPHGQFDFANFLAYSNSYTLNGRYFRIKPTLNTVAIQNYFALSANVPEVLLSVELRYSDDATATWSYTNVIDINVHNSLFQGGELSSFAISSFLSQIVPIMASFSAPINVFNNNITLNDGTFYVKGGTTGIVLSGGGNFINMPSLSSKIFVNGNIVSPTLSTQSIKTTVLSSNSFIGNSIETNFGTVAILSSLQVNTNTINALTGTIGTLNISSVEVGGFVSSGDIYVQGTASAIGLSSQSLISNTGVINTLNVGNITTTTLLLTTLNSTNVNTSILVSNSLSSNSLSSNTLRVNTSVIGTESVGSLSAVDISTNTLTVSGNVIRLLTTNSPASSASPGLTGSLSYDNNFLYVKTFSAWKRVPLSLF